MTMNHRGLRILVLLWACAWFGVIVPGHERGQIKLPGAGATQGCDSCCDAPASHPKSSKEKADPAANCAICFLTAQLQTPTTIDLTLPHVGLLGVLPVLPLIALDGVRFIPTVQGRGPPVHLFA